MKDRDWPRISVTFITYDRLATLVPTLSSFLKKTDYPRDRLELIVADDNSPEAVQAEIRRLPFDVFALGAHRRGCGGNQNRGVEAATGEFILQLQDDWECIGDPCYLKLAVAAMDMAPKLGMVILRPHPNLLPVLKRVSVETSTLTIYENNPSKRVRRVGEHAYTDWPHLKRKAFHQSLGLYKEGVPMWETELDFSQRVNAQTAQYVGDLGFIAFEHIGEALSYNESSKKRSLSERLIRRLKLLTRP